MDLDIRERSRLINAITMFKPDILIHCAVEPVQYPIDEWVDVQTNVGGTCNLIHAAKLCEVKRFIYFQTVLIYGAVYTQEPLPVDYRTDPKSSYAISKLCAENYIKSSGLDYISFRLANHYGPRNLTGAFPVFFKKLTAGESCTIVDARRSLVFISDLVNLVMKGCDLSYPGGVYHVSSDESFLIKDIFFMMFDMLNGWNMNKHIFKDADPNDMHTMILDWTKTKEVFGWEPLVSVKEGVIKTVNWYKANGVEKTFTHLKGA
jgi:UDP-glucose 4-epimerase